VDIAMPDTAMPVRTASFAIRVITILRTFT
jgi:hypothetical protein